MSQAKLARVGVSVGVNGLDANYLPPEVTPDLDPDTSRDIVRAVAKYEFQFCLGNM